MTAKVGDRLGPLTMPPITTTQLVKYAGACGDFNRIHYDEPFARAGGYPQVIAHGMLSMAFFGRLLSDWAGPTRIRKIAARFKAVTFPGDVISVSGEVTEIVTEGAVIQLIARKQDGTVTLEGSAVISLD